MPSTTAILSCVVTLLSFTPRALAEVCDLCPNPDHLPGDVSAKFQYTKGERYLCLVIYNAKAAEYYANYNYVVINRGHALEG